MFVSVIIPAYKQEATIKKNVEAIYASMEKTRWDYEIIVVVDGFLDKTFEEASKLQHPHLRVVGYPTNYGKGYAVRYGMARASGDYVAFIDGGMEINANGISLILEHMEWYNADIVVASKKHLASRVNMPFLRKFYSFGYHALVRLLFGLKIKDTQTGLKVYKRKVLEDVLPRLLIKEYAFDIELLAVAQYLHHNRIFEAPVEINWDFKGSKFKGFLFMDPYIRKMLLDTLAVFYRLKILRYYDDENRRKWIYNEELQLKVNTGET
ncbi:MAG TPA: glycosyltransferase family 2 protein [Candidatus Saccharimonadales bacterium]|nr:glycosyltransferase family 2 protein [Candidatus Saccharimonadales bacterium]